MRDLIIIGGGAAGLSAAIYAARNRLDVLVVTDVFGGAALEADLVENYPGFESITGKELGEKLTSHAKKSGAEVIQGNVSSISKERSVFKVTSNGKVHEARAVILATGSEHRKVGLLREKEFIGKGVSYCYTCDGPMFKGKTVGVIGGADSACSGALALAEHASKVYIIYRKSQLRGEAINVKRIEENPKIETVFNANVTEILGDKFVKGARLDTGKEIKLDGLFIEIGVLPKNDLAKQLGLDLSDSGHVKSNDRRETNMPGVFAAGDLVENNVIKQYISAASDGATAALSAYEYIRKSS